MKTDDKRSARRTRRARDEQRAQQRAVRALGGAQHFDHYVVVLTSSEATMVANVLARLALALDGTTLRVGDGDDVLFDITPRDIKHAHSAVIDALTHRWLGTHDT